VFGMVVGHNILPALSSGEPDARLFPMMCMGLLVMFCCFVGAVLSVSEDRRRFGGSVPFELAALFVSGVVIGAAASSFIG
jgi:hypothetical protein